MSHTGGMFRSSLYGDLGLAEIVAVDVSFITGVSSTKITLLCMKYIVHELLGETLESIHMCVRWTCLH